MLTQEQAIKLATTDFRAYIALTAPYFKFSRLHTFLIDKIQQVVDGTLPKICISLPPRHGKSLVISELLPAFALVRNPLEQIMTISYSASLAQAFGYKVRTAVQGKMHNTFFPWAALPDEGRSGAGLRLRPYEQLIEEYEGRFPEPMDLYYGFGSGSTLNAGVGGPITGKPCTLGIIDDPIKNRAQAESPAYIKTLHNFFGPTFFSRLEPGARLIVVHTRWNDNDLIGYILKNLPDWEYIRLPAICDSSDDPLGRSIGEPLFPEKYSLDDLDTIKSNLQSKDWNALYQQNPTTGATNIWEPSNIRILPVDYLPSSYEVLDTIISYDCAEELHDQADYTAITTSLVTVTGKLILQDTIRKRMTFNELCNTMKELELKHKRPLHLIEKKSNGTALAQYIEANMPSLRVVKVSPTKSKIARLALTLPAFEAGSILIAEGLPHMDVLAKEFETICQPINEHDDLADSFIQAINYWAMQPVYAGLAEPSNYSPMQVLTTRKRKVYGKLL